MANNGNSSGKKELSDKEKLKIALNYALINDQRIEQLWDMVFELKSEAIRNGWKVNDAQIVPTVIRERKKVSALQESQRTKLRQTLGLND